MFDVAKLTIVIEESMVQLHALDKSNRFLFGVGLTSAD